MSFDLYRRNDSLDIVRGTCLGDASSPGEMSRLPLGWIVSTTGRNSMPHEETRAAQAEHRTRGGLHVFAAMTANAIHVTTSIPASFVGMTSMSCETRLDSEAMTFNVMVGRNDAFVEN